jgi:hypothetical protein
MEQPPQYDRSRTGIKQLDFDCKGAIVMVIHNPGEDQTGSIENKHGVFGLWVFAIK